METMISRIDKILNLSWFTSKTHMSAIDVQTTSFAFKNGLQSFVDLMEKQKDGDVDVDAWKLSQKNTE